MACCCRTYSSRTVLRVAGIAGDQAGMRVLSAGAPQNNAFAFDYGMTAVVSSSDDEADAESDAEAASLPLQPVSERLPFRLPFAVPASLNGKVPTTLRQHQVLMRLKGWYGGLGVCFYAPLFIVLATSSELERQTRYSIR